MGTRSFRHLRARFGQEHTPAEVKLFNAAAAQLAKEKEVSRVLVWATPPAAIFSVDMGAGVVGLVVEVSEALP